MAGKQRTRVREWFSDRFNPFARAAASAVQPVRELIGRISYQYPSSVRGGSLSVDKTQPDYVFWDKFRRGKARGNEISGLFGQRIVSTIASFELGSGMSVTLDINDEEVEDSAEARNVDAEAGGEESPRVYTDRLLDRFVKRSLAQLIRIEEDKLALGDQFVIVNADGSLTVASPETVDLEYSDEDFRTLTKVTVTTVLEKVGVKDEYTATTRTVTIKRFGRDTPQVTVYPNLIGRIPVVHWACNKGANEAYGHPLYEALYRVFSRYDDLIEKALDGVELLGNPIPVFTGIDDVQKFLQANGVLDDQEFLDPLTNMPATRKVLALDRLPAVILGIGGDMKMVAPDKGFTTDIEKMLQTLFLLMCFHVSVPEFVFGGGMNASRASLEVQFPPFAKFIETMRLFMLGDGADDFLDVQAKGGLYEVIDLWLRVRQLTDPDVIVAPVKVQFPEITPEDAAVQLQKIIYAKGVNLIQKKTTLEKLRLVSDPDEEVRLAEDEAAEAAEEDYQTMLNQVARQDLDPNASGRGNRSGITSGTPPDPDGGRNVRLNNGQPVGEMKKTKRKRKRRSAYGKRTPAVPQPAEFSA